ncbi:MAG: ABC transporter permease [Acidobacteria bacterium]|nr:ABC transporter permease [Acidobacteriota bacterium]
MFTDLRYSLRALRKRPGFSAVAILMLAVGIGGAAAMFSCIDTWIIRPFAYPAPERLVVLRTIEKHSGTEMNVSLGDLRDWAAGTRAFATLSAWVWDSFTLEGDQQAERVEGTRVSASFFPTLGTRMELGRGFDPGEEVPGADRVAVVSYGFWQGRLNGRANVVGSTLRLSGEIYTLVGVLPEAFHFPLAGRANIWVPLAPTDTQVARRQDRFYNVLGRVKDGPTLRQSQQELDSAMKMLIDRFPTTHAGLGVQQITLKQEQGRHTGDSIILAIFLVTLGLLLVACTNVGNLLLVRALGRQRQAAVQMSLGASRGRLIAQALFETLVLFGLAAVLGSVLGLWLVDWLWRMIPFENRGYLPNYGVISFSWMAWAFSFGLALVAGAIFGLVPALEGARANLALVLKESGSASSTTRSGQRMRGAFAVAQVLMATVLVVDAGVMVLSFRSLWEMPQGFQPNNVLSFQVSLDERRYAGARQRREYFETLAARLGANASISQFIPFQDSGQSSFERLDRPVIGANRRPIARFNAISPGFTATLNIPVRRGRAFTDRDTADSPPVALISETLARETFAGEDPIGRRLKLGRLRDRVVEIVGILPDVRNFSTQPRSEQQLYVPFAQNPSSAAMLALRTTGDPYNAAQMVRSITAELDRAQPLSNIKSMDDRMNEAYVPYRLTAILLAGFGGLALVLAAFGVYAVVAFAVAQRTKEFGIRAALGADAQALLMLVLRQGVRILMWGLVPGLVISAVAANALRSLIAEVQPMNVALYGAALVVLGASVLGATLIPAWRASRIDPLRALRTE